MAYPGFGDAPGFTDQRNNNMAPNFDGGSGGNGPHGAPGFGNDGPGFGGPPPISRPAPSDRSQPAGFGIPDFGGGPPRSSQTHDYGHTNASSVGDRSGQSGFDPAPRNNYGGRDSFSTGYPGASQQQYPNQQAGGGVQNQSPRDDMGYPHHPRGGDVGYPNHQQRGGDVGYPNQPRGGDVGYSDQQRGGHIGYPNQQRGGHIGYPDQQRGSDAGYPGGGQQGYVAPPGMGHSEPVSQYPMQQQPYGVGPGMSRGRPYGDRGGFRGRGRGGGDHMGGGHQVLPSQQGKQITNTVWLGGLTTEHEDTLYDAFKDHGKVLKVSKMGDKGIAFIHFETIEEAKYAADTVAAAGTLSGYVKINFGKMFSYAPQDLEQMERDGPYPSFHRRGAGGPRTVTGNAANNGPRAPGAPETSHILYVGDLTPDITEEDLNMQLSVFGKIVSQNRIEHKGIAFVHFEREEDCAKAVRLMRGVLTIRDRHLRLNFGNPKRKDPESNEGFNAPDFSNEHPTNVVWIGNVPPGVSEQDLDSMFEPFEGFIDAKLYAEKNIAFGHFETIDQSIYCRRALHGKELAGVVMELGYGKSNHTRTVADRYALTVVPGSGADAHAGNELVLMAPGNAPTLQAPTAVPDYLKRKRPQITVSLDQMLSSLLASSYYTGGTVPPYLGAHQVQEICMAVDNMTGHGGAIDPVLKAQLRQKLQFGTVPHAFAVIARRLKEHFMDDPHRRIIALYTCASIVHDCGEQRPLLETFALVVAATAAKQDKDANGYIKDTVQSIYRYLPKAEGEPLSPDGLLKAQLENLMETKSQASDLGDLLKKFKK